MKSRGKEFESIVYKGLLQVEDVSVDRLKDPAPGMKGVSNVSDFIVYKFPYQYYIECKTTHSNTLNFKNAISENQWNGMLYKWKIDGVFSGILVWFVKKDITCFVSIDFLEKLKQAGEKSFNVKTILQQKERVPGIVILKGKKKRVYFEYDFELFMIQLKYLY